MEGQYAMKRLGTVIGCALLLVLVSRALAQVQVGDNLRMNLNGQASVGYTDDYGNQMSSDHGITFGGNANLIGSYYDPNFLSFNINPFYNQSRLNSNFQSNSNASGVNAAVSIFGGSNYPGSISYSKVYNSDGTFGIPGLPNYTTHGNSDALGINWGIYVPSYPTLLVGYQQGSNDFSIYGENSTNTSSFHSFNLRSMYQVAGFQLNAGYERSATHSELPEFLVDQQPQASDSSGDTFTFGVGHQLPLHGNFSANYNRSDFSSTYGVTLNSAGTVYSGTVNSINANVYVNPVERLSVGVNTNYTDNLLGSLYQPILTSGVMVQQVIPGQSTHSLDVTAYTNYVLSKHWNLNGSAEYRDQSNLAGIVPISGLVSPSYGGSISSEVFTGTATYVNVVKGGILTALIGLQQNNVNSFSSSSSGNSTIGVISSVNYGHEFGSWAFAGGFSYSQNTQTVLVGYTTSNMGYSGNMLHAMGRWRWSATAGGSKSLLNHTGYSTFAQNYSTSLSGRWIGVNANYNQSSGNALLAGSGLVPTPLPPIVLPSQLIFYGGEGWGFGFGSNPLKGLAISASYSKSNSNTGSTLTPYSYNHNEQLVFSTQYQLRQLYINAGYSRLVQGFSASGTTPALLGTYYFGIQRWFNFF
jgi:hypothetical protein